MLRARRSVVRLVPARKGCRDQRHAHVANDVGRVQQHAQASRLPRLARVCRVCRRGIGPGGIGSRHVVRVGARGRWSRCRECDRVVRSRRATRTPTRTHFGQSCVTPSRDGGGSTSSLRGSTASTSTGSIANSGKALCYLTVFLFERLKITIKGGTRRVSRPARRWRRLQRTEATWCGDPVMYQFHSVCM